ncbi:uncharacterized protein LOC117120497 [Anneissia japonica]|uniref:uncharacterized protein LOC117120497 n=1 Tax=Anneissia japonica TaxID=1529436 RepID=UPI001425730E|nr:uncharacterized protein LOC117120497 [Anneissia japonica]
MTRSLVLDKADKTKWIEKEIDHKDEIKEKHENALATKAAEDLQKIEDLSSPKSTGFKMLVTNNDQQRKKSSDDTTADEETKQSTINTNTEIYQATASASQLPIEVTTQPQRIDENVIEKIVQVMKGKSIKDNSLRIWDFGGQLIYHSIHRATVTYESFDYDNDNNDHNQTMLYMTPESIFVIVFNLLYELDELAKVLDSSGNEHVYYMTNLEYLLYWIRSAYTYTKDKVFYTDPLINFPVFIIVGTHCKSLSKIEVEEKLDKIRKAIEKQVFKTHVYKEYFAVENNLFFFSDMNVLQLKKVILETKEKMKRPIPLKWLDLLIAIQKLSEENVTLPLVQVKSMAKRCGILDDKTIDVAITYLSDEAKLIDDWKKLEKGVLTKHLLKHLWKEFPIFKNDTDEKMFNFFVNLMNKFGLLCQKKKQNTDSDGIAYYAISHLPPKQCSEDPNDDQGSNKISIFHDFHGFLPDYLFHLAVTKFIEEFQVENGPDPTLAYEHAELNIDDHHYVRIAVTTINHQRMFKTTIVRRQEPNACYVVEPVPETCKQVLSFLQLVLEGLCCARGIQYKMCIPCSCPDKCQRMHNVTNFNKHIVFCGDFVISIKRYCRLFGAEVGNGASSSEQITIQGMTDMQFNALKMDVSMWYDDHKCLTMLKVLFRDHVGNERLSKITNTLDLLNDLVARGHLHLGNLAILHDTISITEHFGLQQKIKVKLPSFPDVTEGLISKQFSYYRQRLMKCGMTLSPDNVTQIDGLLNTPRKDYIDGWSMIIDLEDAQIISEKNMDVFIDSLKMLKIYSALNALLDVL